MWWISVDCKSTASGYLRFDSFLPHFNRNLCPWLMESDVGRDTNKLFIVPDITSLGGIVIQIIRCSSACILNQGMWALKKN